MTTWTSAASILATSRTHSFVLRCIAGWRRSWTGADPGSVTEARDMEIMDFEPAGAPSAPSRNRRLVAQVILAAAAVVVIALVATRDDDSTPADQPSPTVDRAPDRASASADQAEQHPEQLAPGTYFADWFSGTRTTNAHLRHRRRRVDNRATGTSYRHGPGAP